MPVHCSSSEPQIGRAPSQALHAPSHDDEKMLNDDEKMVRHSLHTLADLEWLGKDGTHGRYELSCTSPDCTCKACKVTARADRILKSMLDVDVPENHAELFIVARKCLNLLVALIMSRQWKIDGWICSPALDFMEGMELLLSELKVSWRPSKVVVFPSLVGLTLTHQRNLLTAINAWPCIRTLKFPVGIVPFWESELMHSCRIYTDELLSCTGHELVQNPASDTWPQSGKAFFVVFHNICAGRAQPHRLEVRLQLGGERPQGGQSHAVDQHHPQ